MTSGLRVVTGTSVIIKTFSLRLGKSKQKRSCLDDLHTGEAFFALVTTVIETMGYERVLLLMLLRESSTHSDSTTKDQQTKPTKLVILAQMFLR